MKDANKLFQEYGPLLIQALAFVIRDEINILRVKAELSERTNEQIVNALETKLSALIN